MGPHDSSWSRNALSVNNNSGWCLAPISSLGARKHNKLIIYLSCWLQVECELFCIKAACTAAGGDPEQPNCQAVRQLAHAVHLCPWHTTARLRLAQQALAARARLAQSAFKVCPSLLPQIQNESSSPAGSLQLGGAGSGQTAMASSHAQQQYMLSEVLAAATCRTTALSGQVAAAVAAEAGLEVHRLSRLVHALPSSADLWYCLALAAVLRAVGDRQARHFRFACKCAVSALQQFDRLMRNLQQGSSQQPAAAQTSTTASTFSSSSLQSSSIAGLQKHKIWLMTAVSECYEHSRLPGCHDNAVQWAMDALAAAMSAGGVASAQAHRQVGRMLALDGMLDQAEVALRQAVAAAGDGAAEAVLALAKLLASQGRQQEAAELLHGVWQEAAPTAPETATLQESLRLPAGPQYVEVAALEEALMLADLGQWQAARTAAAAGLKLATSAGETAPAAAELVQATVSLQAATAAPPDSARSIISEARWAASSAARSGMALPGTVGSAVAGVGAAVLAQVELARGKPGKAYDAVGMSFGAWVDRAVPAQVLATAGELTGQVTDCAVAVHTAPWDRAGWERLSLAAAARG